ncbi:ATP-dependent DNA ligase [Sphingosinicellaceae bacterium]|nr:ATP-dependent DNA ligase [Sphingosinicellaceae bacterium]
MDTTLAPMEAKLVAVLPDESGWQFEPKWDGFRCLVFRSGDDIVLMSKSGKPLGRYFPEVTALVAALRARRFVLDGELLIDVEGALSFDALQARLHPAESRILKLSVATPARLMVFDLLDDGEPLAGLPLSERRTRLEAFVAANPSDGIALSPATTKLKQAQAWLERSGAALDGVVAKRFDQPYRFGERAMLKVKRQRTADCVVGGFRYGANSTTVASLLLGLYDDAGLLNHVGFTSGLGGMDLAALTKQLEALPGEGFTGKAPGGPSRWSTERSSEWVPLAHDLVVEVRFDQVTGDRFRHGTGFLRWRPDKAPGQCTMEQLGPPLRPGDLGVAF